MRTWSLILSLTAVMLAGCAGTVDVQPVAVGTPLKLVYIQRNPAADEIAPDLESAIANGLQRHSIGTKVIAGEPPNGSGYLLTYAATGGWDLKPFTKTAELRLKQGVNRVGYARYDSAGGFGTTKFLSARSKSPANIRQGQAALAIQRMASKTSPYAWTRCGASSFIKIRYEATNAHSSSVTSVG